MKTILIKLGLLKPEPITNEGLENIGFQYNSDKSFISIDIAPLMIGRDLLYCEGLLKIHHVDEQIGYSLYSIEYIHQVKELIDLLKLKDDD